MRLAFLLIPTLTIHADEHLATAAARMVHMPVIAAARLEGDVKDRQIAILAADLV